MLLTITTILVFAALLVPVAVAQSAHATGPKLSVTVDPRMELLTTVQDLAGYGEKMDLLTQFKSKYRNDMRKHFGRHKNHRAVALFAEMSGKAFNYSAPIDAMLYFSDPPALEPVLPVPAFTLMRAGGQEKLDEFMQALRDFAVESDFAAFSGAHRDLYTELEARTLPRIDPADIAFVEKYFGMSAKDYTIVIVPLLHRGGYGPRVDLPDGSFEIYAVCGPAGVTNGMEQFGDEERWKSLFSHEFAHSFVNPITDRFTDEYRPHAKKIGAPIRKMVGDSPNWAWVTDEVLAAEWINETVIRAYTSRLSLHRSGAKSADTEIKRHTRNGWTDVRAVFNLLEKYETNRDAYPTFVDFYAEILKLFTGKDAAGGT